MLMLPNCNLPGCIMVEVLSRLPVKSMLRFRSVCRPWYLLLISPGFITMHVRLQQTNTDKLLTENDLLINYPWYVVPALYVYDRKDNKSFDLPLHLFPFDSASCVKIVGTCNGLVCARGYINRKSALILWNPATRQFKYLDPPPNTWLSPSLFVEFGFLQDINDYKVVVTRFSFNRGHMVFVYTLSSDSWRVKEIPGLVARRFNGRAITLNGVFYWPGNEFNGTEIIVSFDLRDEVFGQLKVPPSDPFRFGGKRTKSELVVLKGSLSLIYYPKMEEKYRSFEIWVMTEQGIDESWSKLYTLGPFRSIIEPVGSWKDGEIIFRYPKSRSNVMFSYNTCTHQSQHFAVPEARGLIRAFNYVESLEVVEKNRSCSSKCAITGRDPRIQMPNENSVDIWNCSNDLVWNFAILGPKGSGLLHCRLCWQLFYHFNATELQLHLAHRSSICSPCPNVSESVRRQMLGYGKNRACVPTDIIMGTMRTLYGVLKKKLIKKRGQRPKVDGNISLPRCEDINGASDEFDDDDFDDEFDDDLI